jgi:hypothetical protein
VLEHVGGRQRGNPLMVRGLKALARKAILPMELPRHRWELERGDEGGVVVLGATSGFSAL